MSGSSCTMEQASSRLILVRTNVTAFATRSNVSVWRMHRSDELGSATTLWASSFVIRNDVLYKESHGLPLSKTTSAWCRLQRPSEGSQMISTVLILLAKSPPRQLPLTLKRQRRVGQFVDKGEVCAGANVAKPTHVPTHNATDHETKEQPQHGLHDWPPIFIDSMPNLLLVVAGTANLSHCMFVSDLLGRHPLRAD